MPWGVRITDEESLREEARKNPKSTRWVTKRGVVRKKQGSGKERRNVVKIGKDQDVYAREKHAQQEEGRRMRRGDKDERDVRAQPMHASGAPRTRHPREKETRTHHGSNSRRGEVPPRSSDTFHDKGDDCEDDEYDFDHHPYHGTRNSPRPGHFYDEEDEHEAHLERLRRLEALSHSYSRPLDQNQGLYDTRRPSREAVTRESQNRQGLVRKTDEREVDKRGSRSHPASNHRRGSDLYSHEDDDEDEYAHDYRPRRSSRRPDDLDDDEDNHGTEVYSDRLRRSRPPNPTYNQSTNRNQPAYSTERQTPRSKLAAAPWKSDQDFRHQDDPSRRVRQAPHPQPRGRTGAPRQEMPELYSDGSPAYYHKHWAPSAAEAFAVDVDPMIRAGRTWDSRETVHARGNLDFW